MHKSNNQNSGTGFPARGRGLFIGGMARVIVDISSDFEMPNCHIPHNLSWHELNRGKRSKQERRK